MNSFIEMQSTNSLLSNSLDQVRYEAVIQSSSASESSASGLQTAGHESPFAKAVAKIALPMLYRLSYALSASGVVCAKFDMSKIAYSLVAVGLLLRFCLLKGNKVGGPNDTMIEKPQSPETVIKQSIDQAFDSLPNRIQLEMSKLPNITPERARRYNTTVDQLQTDQVQAIKIVSLHTVLDHLKSATDEHWDRHNRQAQKSEINAYAKSAILDKLTQLQNEEGLGSLVAQAAKTNVAPQSQYGVSQREFFALNRIAEGLIRNCLTQTPAVLTDRFWVPVASIAQSRGDHAMTKAIESLYMAFDEFVRPNDAEPDMTRVSRLLGDTSNDPVAKQWLGDQQSSFNKQINNAFKPFGKYAGNFAKVVLEGYLQQAGKLKTAFVQDRPAFSGARQKLEQVRQEASKNGAFRTQDLKGWLQTGLQGIREMIEDPTVEFSDQREAQDDNRSGTPWKDSRLHQHVENMANPKMLARVRPHQRAAVLDALAAYGEKTVKLFNEDGVTIRTGREGYLLAVPDVNDKKEEIHYSPYQGIGNGKLAGPLVVASHYVPLTKRVTLSHYHTEVLRDVAVHELGHALDGAIAKQRYSAEFFTERYTNLRTEFKNAKKDKTMITRYAQMNHHEMFAESAAAYMGTGNGSDSTFAKPEGSIKSRENLQARHPVTAQFLDEVLRAPNKAVRAANTPLTVDAAPTDNRDPAEMV